MSNSQENKKPNKALKIVLNVILWIFLAFAFVTMIFAFTSTSNKYGISTLGNKVILTVKTDSMEPTIMKGDMIVGTTLSDEEKKALQEGDIITFYVDLNGDGVKELNTHRIVSIEHSGENYQFYTKGDKEGATEDPGSIYLNDIVCTWHEGDTQIHGLGGVISFIQGRVGFLVCVILPLIALFVFEIVRFIVMAVRIKGKDKQKELSDEEKDEIRRQAIEEYKRSLAVDTEEKSADETVEPTATETTENTEGQGGTEE
ncbi:MAG: signal peptidase I [Clostridia bacterium]|nr:signal peptidase I [Clostridia bacterium]